MLQIMFPTLQILMVSMSHFYKFASETSVRQFYCCYLFPIRLNAEEPHIAKRIVMAASQLILILLTPLFTDAL